MQHDAQIRRMQPVQADSRNEIQALREEVRELRGLVADLKKVGGAGVMVDKLNRHDAALHQIETSMAMQFDLGDPIAVNTPAGAVAAPAAAETGEAAASGPAYGGLVEGTAAGTAAVATAAAAGGTWGQETPKPKQPAVQKDMRVALYEAGVNAFNARKYSDAQRSFSDYLQNYAKADDKTTANAQYYLGECYFQKNQFPDAALAYDTVITKYPKSAKAPAAYLKQGICFSKMKQTAAARGRMNELIKKYPNSTEAARAKDFLKNNK